MCRISARMHRQTPARSTWRISMKSCSAYSSSGTYGPGTPALLCAASSLPNACTARSMAKVTAWRSLTSATSVSARPPAAWVAAAVFARPSASMSTSATEAPADAKERALARPMPEAAPLIRRGDPQGGADLLCGHPADVAHGHHLALPWRQRRQRAVDLEQDLLAEHHAFRGLRGLPGSVFQLWLGNRPSLADTAGPGLVDQDRERPCPQRRPAFERGR